jgi:hypothetical protein
VALCQARTSTKPLWGLSSSNPYHPSHVPNKHNLTEMNYSGFFYNMNKPKNAPFTFFELRTL